MDKPILQSKETSNKNIENNNDLIAENLYSVEISEVNFPDEVFRDYVVRNFDTNSDGFLSRDEIKEALIVDVSFNKQITSLQGIEILSSLERLVIYNTNIKELPIFSNIFLKYLDCSNTEIKELDISHTSLVYLDCSNTKIEKLDIHGSHLRYLDCSNTDIKELNLSRCASLCELHCENTKIKELNIINNSNFYYLSCDNIKLRDINFYNSNLKSHLFYLICNNTEVKKIDFNSNHETDKKPLLNSKKM